MFCSRSRCFIWCQEFSGGCSGFSGGRAIRRPRIVRHRRLHELELEIRRRAPRGRANQSVPDCYCGAATLKGKEIAEVLSDRNFPSADIKLLDDDESLGQLETAGEEISFIQSVRAEQFEHVDFTFF